MKRHSWPIGVDDSGRGTLAGPLVICALHHPDSAALLRLGARDCKQTTPAERALFMDRLRADGRARWKCTAAMPEWVEAAGHATASFQKMRSAVDLLTRKNDIEPGAIDLRIDGLSRATNMPLGAKVVHLAHGDQNDPLIAAASIVARYTYDLIMKDLSHRYPQWRFTEHWGYDSKVHREVLYALGPSPLHRKRPTANAMRTHCRKRGIAEPAWLKENHHNESKLHRARP